MSARNRRRSIKAVWLKCYTCGAMAAMGNDGIPKDWTCSKDEGCRWYCPKCSVAAANTPAKFGPQPAPDDPRIWKGTVREFFDHAASIAAAQ